MFNRRYIIDRKKNIIIFKNIGTKHPACPIKSDKYRIENYYSYMVIKPYSDLDKPGIEFGLTYYDNPGISIPDAVTSWVAMKAMPEFLKRLRGAAKEYKSYLETTGQIRISDVSSPKDKIPEDDSVLETSLERNNVPAVSRARKLAAEVSVERESSVSNVEVLISPSAAPVSSESDSSYWKYLRPTYYFG